MRKTLLSALAVAVLLGTSTLAPAQDSTKNFMTISFSGYDDLMEKIDIVGRIAGVPDLGETVEGAIMFGTQGKGLAGLDTTKPWGALIKAEDSDEPPVLGFVPVTDLDQFLQILEPVIGQPEDAGNGIKKVQTPGPPGGPPPTTVYLKAQGGWAFISNRIDLLANPPADPVKELKGLNEKYVVAYQISMQNLPPAKRAEMKGDSQAAVEMLNAQLAAEGNEIVEIFGGLIKRVVEQMTDMQDDMDEVVVGWAVDEQSKSAYLDIQVTAVAGTKSAARFNEPSPGKTGYAGFDLPGAAVTGNVGSILSAQDVADLNDVLAKVRAKAMKDIESQGLSDAESQAVTQMLGDLMDVAKKTVDNKLVDGGFAVVLKSGSVAAVAGGAIGEGDKLEKVIKQLAQLAVQENPGIGQILKMDADTHEGIRFHSITLPVEDENAARILGDTIDVVVGIGDSSLYVGAGQEVISVLKQVIDKSKADADKQVPPLRVAVSMAPVMKFAAKVADGPPKQMLAALSVGLQFAGGKDHISLTATEIPNGSQMRLELEEGILKLIGGAAQMLGAMGGGGSGGPPPGF